MARITKTIFLTAAEAAVYKSTGTCQHVTPDGDTITVSDTDTDCIVYCPEDEPVTKAELAEAVKHHYSTTEQVVGTWIDGKPLYERTIHIEYAQSIIIRTDESVTIETNTDVDRVLFGNVATVGNNGSNNEANNNGFKVRKDVDNDFLFVQASTNYVGVSVIDTTVRYTKTTD